MENMNIWGVGMCCSIHGSLLLVHSLRRQPPNASTHRFNTKEACGPTPGSYINIANDSVSGCLQILRSLAKSRGHVASANPAASVCVED
jgi:hypothetical protein